MTAVLLGLGSNVYPEEHLQQCLAQLEAQFEVEAVSPWYHSKAIGFEGENFINLVVKIQYNGPLLELAKELKHIELACGRPEKAEKFAPRCIDIDILLFGELVGEFNGIKLPRADLYRYAYALKPLLDIHAKGYDPQTGRQWQEFWPQVQEQWLQPVTAEITAADAPPDEPSQA